MVAEEGAVEEQLETPGKIAVLYAARENKDVGGHHLVLEHLYEAVALGVLINAVGLGRSASTQGTSRS